MRRRDFLKAATALAITPALRAGKAQTGAQLLVVKPAAVRLGGRQVQLLTYQGAFPGPTMRFAEGEEVSFTLVNRLSAETNLHTHGLPISPLVDDPLAIVPPGEEREYAFTVPPGSAGTYWYHPHRHGQVAQQLFAGLAGAILITAPWEQEGEPALAQDEIALLKDFSLRGTQVAPHMGMDWMNGKEGEIITVNGEIAPRLVLQKGALRLRFINAANARYFNLRIADLPWQVIAWDQGILPNSQPSDSLLLPPGARAEVWISGLAPGEYQVMNLPYDRGAHQMGMHHNMVSPSPETVMTLVVPEKFSPLVWPEGLRPLVKLPGPNAEPVRVELSEDTRNMMNPVFFINGQTFDPGRVDFRAEKGQVALWTVVNRGDMDHPFHLHTHPFWVGGEGFPRDTVNLKAQETVELMVPYLHRGKTVFHCHIVEHEDRGMMGVLEVV